MALYDRLLGYDDQGNPVEGRIPVHQFQALLAEFGRGAITGAQAQTAVESLTGFPLTAAEAQEAQTLLATISGSATAKLARVKLIDDVLMIAETRTPPYSTPTAVKSRLGV